MVDYMLWLAWNNALGATVIAAIVFVMTRFIRDPQTRHWLWLLVLVRLVLPINIPVSLGMLSYADSQSPAVSSSSIPVKTSSDVPSRNSVPLDTRVFGRGQMA